METVRDLLNEKGSHVWSIEPSANVYDAVKLMSDKQIGALAVLDGDRMVGIISERDYARKVILENKSSKETEVRDIMTQRVIYALPDQTIETCMATMTENHIRHLPVVADDALVGMLSLKDLARAIIAKQRTVIEQLETYIAG